MSNFGSICNGETKRGYTNGSDWDIEIKRLNKITAVIRAQRHGQEIFDSFPITIDTDLEERAIFYSQNPQGELENSDEAHDDWYSVTETNESLSWECVDSSSYVECCYGDDGNEPGQVEVHLIKAEDDDGDEWWTFFEPEACEFSDRMWWSECNAREALEQHCEDRDETPDLDELIAEIEKTEYFQDQSIIPFVVESMTQYSQGYLLLPPDICQPVGTKWTTNGYLECDHIRVDATFDNEALAADALLRSIKSYQED